MSDVTPSANAVSFPVADMERAKAFDMHGPDWDGGSAAVESGNASWYLGDPPVLGREFVPGMARRAR